MRRLCAQFRAIKYDLLHPQNEPTADQNYHEWIKNQREKIIPKKPEELLKGSVFYDLAATPLHYLRPMLYMTAEMEDKEVKLMNTFPLRSRIAPMHFRLDTTTLSRLFTYKPDKNTTTEQTTKEKQDKVWSTYFNTNKKIFKPRATDDDAFTFHHQVLTDGVSCCVLLQGRRAVPPKEHIDEVLLEIFFSS